MLRNAVFFFTKNAILQYDNKRDLHMVEVINFAFFISHVLKKGGQNRKEVAYARSYSKIVVLGMQLDMWVRKTSFGQNNRG